jgi:hypothetical protein
MRDPVLEPQSLIEDVRQIMTAAEGRMRVSGIYQRLRIQTSVVDLATVLRQMASFGEVEHVGEMGGEPIYLYRQTPNSATVDPAPAPAQTPRVATKHALSSLHPEQNMTLHEIETRTRNYRSARDLLGERLHQLETEIESAKRRAMPVIRSALAVAKAAENELQAAISESPELFKKPRTQVFHGVKVGIEKGKGQVVIEDARRTVELIHRHLNDQAELLIKTTETPIKTAIAQLSGAEMKRIGCHVSEAVDSVVIRPVDSELDKLLSALLKADEVTLEAAA